MSNEDFFKRLQKEFKSRNNPSDLKPVIIGKVVQLNPIIVQIAEGKILLKENEELEISEWFRFRCDIDKTGALSQIVVSDRNDSKSFSDSATGVSEIHSFNGAPCTMPDAVSYLADSITSLSDAVLQINNELLALKCRLQLNDFISVASLEETDKYILLDKVL